MLPNELTYKQKLKNGPYYNFILMIAADENEYQ